VRGFIVAGSRGRTWFKHMIENERVRLTSQGKTASGVNDAVKVFSQFYDLYLMQGQTPGQILALRPQGRYVEADEMTHGFTGGQEVLCPGCFHRFGTGPKKNRRVRIGPFPLGA